MRIQCADTEYKASHLCGYSYFPQWLGTSKDGINAMQPSEQTSEFFAGLAEPLVKCFETYGNTFSEVPVPVRRKKRRRKPSLESQKKTIVPPRSIVVFVGR